MSAITLINSYDGADAAEFRVFQGDHQACRLRVGRGGEATMPTDMEYVVQTTTNMDDFTLTSNTISFEGNSIKGNSIILLAQIVVEKGYSDFQLEASQGTQPDMIVLKNTWENPVHFKIIPPNDPMQIITVVDEHNYPLISTTQAWTIYAIVNGITTETVETDNPNATIRLVSDYGPIRLEVS
jgi:hypothetical protein